MALTCQLPTMWAAMAAGATRTMAAKKAARFERIERLGELVMASLLCEVGHGRAVD